MRTPKRGSYQAQYSRALSAVTVTGRWVAVINQPGRTSCFWLPHSYAGTVIFPLQQLCQLSHTKQHPSPHKKTCPSSHCAKHYQDQWHKWPFNFNNIGNTAQQTSAIDFFVCVYMSPYIHHHFREACVSIKKNWFRSNDQKWLHSASLAILRCLRSGQLVTSASHPAEDVTRAIVYSITVFFPLWWGLYWRRGFCQWESNS